MNRRDKSSPTLCRRRQSRNQCVLLLASLVLTVVLNEAGVEKMRSMSGVISPVLNRGGAMVAQNGPPPPMLVQSTPGSSVAGSRSGTVSFRTASVAGDTIVLFVRFGGTTIANVTDNQPGKSNAYTSVLGPTSWGVTPNSTDRWAQIFVATNITGGATLSITVILSGKSTHDIYVAALEYSGVDPANPVNATASGTGTTWRNGAPATPSLMTTVTNAKLVATSWDSNESYTSNGNGTGYTTVITGGITSLSGGRGWPNLTEDRTAAAAGAWNATARSSPAVNDWVIQLVALAPPASAPVRRNGSRARAARPTKERLLGANALVAVF